MSDPRLHMIAVTGIVVRDGKFLILQRAKTEKAYPGMWTVPGGKLVRHEYDSLPLSANSDGWYGIVARTLEKEIREEAGIEVANVKYLTDMAFIRPDDVPALVLSYWCTHKAGEVMLGKDMIGHAWVTLEEAKKYELIPGIWEEIAEVDHIVKSGLV